MTGWYRSSAEDQPKPTNKTLGILMQCALSKKECFCETLALIVYLAIETKAKT